MHARYGPPAVVGGVSTMAQPTSVLKEQPLVRGEWSPGTRRVGLIARKVGIYPMWKKDGSKILTTLLQVYRKYQSIIVVSFASITLYLLIISLTSCNITFWYSIILYLKRSMEFKTQSAGFRIKSKAFLQYLWKRFNFNLCNELKVFGKGVI